MLRVLRFFTTRLQIRRICRVLGGLRDESVAIYVFIRSRCSILNISSIEKGKNKSGSPIFSHEVAVIKLLNRKNEDRKILKGREREFRAASFSKTFFNNNPRKLFNTKQNKKTSIDVKVLSFCNVT